MTGEIREVCSTCAHFLPCRFEDGRHYDGWCLVDVYEERNPDEALRVPNKHRPCGRWDAQGEMMWRGI